MNVSPDVKAAALFRQFARFEYTLKATGHHNGEGAAQPNWRRFAEAIDGDFAKVDGEEFAEALAYFREHPPKKQVVRNGVLDWEDTEPQTDLEADRILLYVRRVRNNLFHGGKFNGRWFEPQRSAELLQHSMAILDRCLELSPAVREAYGQE